MGRQIPRSCYQRVRARLAAAQGLVLPKGSFYTLNRVEVAIFAQQQPAQRRQQRGIVSVSEQIVRHQPPRFADLLAPSIVHVALNTAGAFIG